MADKVYPSAKAEMMKGLMDLEAVDLRIVLIDVADYTYSDAHNFLDDVPSGARVGTPVALDNAAVSADGILDSDPATLVAVTGDVCEAALIFVHTGSDATARLVCYRDTGTGLPVTPSGDDIILTPHVTNGWFKL